MAVAALLWFSAATSAHAQGPTESELAQARERFKIGLGFVEQSRWAEAADVFEEVLAVKASPVVTYNLALAWVKLGKLLEAAELLRPLARDPSAPDDARGGAEALLRDVEPRLGSITVRATGNTQDIRLFVDSREFTASWLGRLIEVNPGDTEVRALRQGQQIAREWIQVPEGSRDTEVTLALGTPDDWGAPKPVPLAVPTPQQTAANNYAEPEPEPAVAMDYSEDRNSSGSVFGKWWFWTVVGVAAAGGVTAALLLTADDTAAAPVGGDIGTGVIRSMVSVDM